MFGAISVSAPNSNCRAFDGRDDRADVCWCLSRPSIASCRVGRRDSSAWVSHEHRSTNGLRSGLRNSIKLRNEKTATSAPLPKRPSEFRRTISDSHPSRRCISPATASNGTSMAVTAGNSTNIRGPGRRIACPRMTISHSGRALLALRYCCAGRKVSFLIRKQRVFSHISDRLRLVTIVGAGHWLHHDKLDEVLGELCPFLVANRGENSPCRAS